MEQVAQAAPVHTEPNSSGNLGAHSVFQIPEDHLTTALGVPRRMLREARSSSTQGVDWEICGGKRVFWSQQAVDRFVAHISPENGTSPPPDSLAAPSGAAVAGPQVHAELEKSQVLKVVQWNFPNRRVIHCVPENGSPNALGQERVAVRVRDSRLFRPGMRVLARPILGSAWQFEGNPDNPSAGPRGPRWPGRW